MSTKIITYCDHCGEALKNNNDCKNMEISFSLGGVRWTDLCRDCEEKLEELVFDFVTAQCIIECNSDKGE